MKNKQLSAVMILVLAVFLLQSLSVKASAAQIPDPGSPSNDPAQTDCAAVLANAESRLASIDIPASRADYRVFEQVAACALAAGQPAVIPATGGTESAYDRYMRTKEQQAERMSR